MKFRNISGTLIPADEATKQQSNGFSEFVELDFAPKKRMTETQRGSLYLWLEQVAVLLNDAGYDLPLFLEKIGAQDVRIPCTKINLKERFYKPILKAMTEKSSTEQQSTFDPNEVYLTASKILAEKFGITPPAWPTRFGDEHKVSWSDPALELYQTHKGSA